MGLLLTLPHWGLWSHPRPAAMEVQLSMTQKHCSVPCRKHLQGLKNRVVHYSTLCLWSLVSWGLHFSHHLLNIFSCLYVHFLVCSNLVCISVCINAWLQIAHTWIFPGMRTLKEEKRYSPTWTLQHPFSLIRFVCGAESASAKQDAILIVMP